MSRFMRAKMQVSRVERWNGSDKITCNAVMPGLIDAPAADAIRGDMRERIAALIPSRRLGTPQEVAYMVSFLASERASYINGESIFVSSGQELFVF